MSDGELVEIEAEGETVGEAKWLGFRKLEQRFPGLDRDLVAFEVLSEGERGLLGVGTAPARVIARFDSSLAPAAGETVEASGSDEFVRDVLTEIAASLGASCTVDVRRAGGKLVATMNGPDVALLIGKRGRTIDAIQYVVGSIVAKAEGEAHAAVVVDAAGYRARREERLVEVAMRSAERARRSGRPVRLEPMASVERKIVHLCLKDVEGIETRSEGDDPLRYVVVSPTRG